MRNTRYTSNWQLVNGRSRAIAAREYLKGKQMIGDFLMAERLQSWHFDAVLIRPFVELTEATAFVLKTTKCTSRYWIGMLLSSFFSRFSSFRTKTVREKKGESKPSAYVAEPSSKYIRIFSSKMFFVLYKLR